jgi:hypothetical protein
MASEKMISSGRIRDRVSWHTLASTAQTNEEINYEYAR